MNGPLRIRASDEISAELGHGGLSASSQPSEEAAIKVPFMV